MGWPWAATSEIAAYWTWPWSGPWPWSGLWLRPRFILSAAAVVVVATTVADALDDLIQLTHDPCADSRYREDRHHDDEGKDQAVLSQSLSYLRPQAGQPPHHKPTDLA